MYKHETKKATDSGKRAYTSLKFHLAVVTFDEKEAIKKDDHREPNKQTKVR